MFTKKNPKANVDHKTDTYSVFHCIIKISNNIENWNGRLNLHVCRRCLHRLREDLSGDYYRKIELESALILNISDAGEPFIASTEKQNKKLVIDWAIQTS